jgi:hypothetical protein
VHLVDQQRSIFQNLESIIVRIVVLKVFQVLVPLDGRLWLATGDTVERNLIHFDGLNCTGGSNIKSEREQTTNIKTI